VSERRRVLLADDREDVRELVAMTLGTDRFEILDAPDGETALRLARSHRPHVILLDVGMPGLDGFAVCRALKADPATRHIPIYMLTAAGAAADRAAGDAAGAAGYFVKPFSPAVLQAEILRAAGQAD
jgi:DNA-binding response OmpR family regulator